MNKFLLIIRSESFEAAGFDEAQVAAHMALWDTYMGALAAQELLVGGQQLQDAGYVLEGSSLTDGPFAEGREVVGGYVMVQARDLAHAAELAKGCPVFELPGGTVEVRELVPD